MDGMATSPWGTPAATAEWMLLWFSPWVMGLLGLCVGSFLNVVIHRLPLMLERGWKLESAQLLGQPEPDLPELSLMRPRSRCPHCGHLIAWYENIPVVSFLWLRGRCSACDARIAWRYPLVELLTAGLFAATAWCMGPQPGLLLWLVFMAFLVAASGIDWDTTLLPDQLTLALLWLGLTASAMGLLPVSPTDAIAGAVAGYGSLWAVYWFFKLATGKEGMGYGDFKLLAALGAWLGPAMIIPIVLGASVIGAVVGIAMKLSHSLREGHYVPFGPFLAGGGITVALAGPERVWQWLGWA
jgi:leader peptidase (prepilin peptidase)/N-methyltransferase